ncbi:hypothetical protein [Roseibium sp.]|uniref:hypothetical protein n=1 Tax=Roseibium sp. TaxID=1936156 RepID=UPI003D0C3167
MAEHAHELAPHHLPSFLPGADGSDPLMTIMTIVLIVGVILIGTFYLHLHSLPERLAHKHHRVQFELVAVLGLLALFTHNTVFWVAALLLAFVPVPDFAAPINSIAASLNRISNRTVTPPAAMASGEPEVGTGDAEVSSDPDATQSPPTETNVSGVHARADVSPEGRDG